MKPWIEETVIDIIKQRFQYKIEKSYPGTAVFIRLIASDNNFNIFWTAEKVDSWDEETEDYLEESFNGEETISKIDALRQAILGDDQLKDTLGF